MKTKAIEMYEEQLNQLRTIIQIEKLLTNLVSNSEKTIKESQKILIDIKIYKQHICDNIYYLSQLVTTH